MKPYKIESGVENLVIFVRSVPLDFKKQIMYLALIGFILLFVISIFVWPNCCQEEKIIKKRYENVYVFDNNGMEPKYGISFLDIDKIEIRPSYTGRYFVYIVSERQGQRIGVFNSFQIERYREVLKKKLAEFTGADVDENPFG
ncbi:MAG TPA: hypothetical protein EYP86_04885 [Candidatus Altiarchaeales archaeon]|nr:hypothetical protein [Candidatus Altiarchaeales archaeon]